MTEPHQPPHQPPPPGADQHALDQHVPDDVPQAPWTLRRTVQFSAGAGALILALASLMAPSAYITEAPGPLFNTTGESDGEPIITVDGRETFETDGALNLTTVYVNGAPTSTVRVPDAVRGWFSSSIDMTPQELVYPSGTTADEVEEFNTAAMTSSQDLALAAALDELNVEYSQALEVVDFTPEARDGGVDDLLQPGDQVLEADGEPITGLEGLRTVVNEAAEESVGLTVVRGGEELDVEVPTYQEADGEHYLGVMLQGEFDFPVDVEIQLQNVGGPSAGLMFALGIVDTLTEDSMTGNVSWAGTGTVDPDGTVGPIGGIAQKVEGSREQGVEHFLSPRDNCAELEGRIPAGVEVYGVDSVSQAREIVEAVRDEDQSYLEGLEACGT